MSKFVFRNTATGEELPYNTQSVKRKIMVPQIVDQPLWDAQGNRVPSSVLAAVNLEVVEYPDQTEAWTEWKCYTSMYATFPEAVGRVTAYKDLMDELELPYNATTDAIEAKIRSKFETDVQAGNELIATINATLLNVKVNYQAWAIAAGLPAYTGNDFTTWYHMPILIKYLPSMNPVEPEYKNPVVVG